MANEQMEIEVVVNGKKAKVELDKFNDSVEQTGQEAKKSGGMLEGMFSKAKIGAVAVLASFTALVAKGKAFSSVTAGLNKELKAYVLEMSNITGMSTEMIAGFAQTGKSAGMTNGEIKEMIDTAQALGRAFPHESVEGFVDNLTMLNTSGEAQGYIVDILEQKWGTIDLKAKTLAEKMAVIKDATKGVNEQFNKASGAKLDVVFTKASNALTSLGVASLNMINKWGWIDAVSEGLTTIIQKLTKVEDMTMKQLERELQARKEALQVAQEEEAGFMRNQAVVDKNIRNKKTQVSYIESRIRAMKVEQEEEKRTAEATVAERTNAMNAEAKLEEQREELKQKQKEADAKLKAEKTKSDMMMANFQANTLTRMGDSIVDYVVRGKNSFKDLALTAVAEFAKIKLAQSMAGLATGGGMLGSIGSFLGFHTGVDEVKHTGGFIGLPSHHSGSIRQDERIAKLQVGEAVINRAGASRNKEAIKAMNAGGTVGGGGNVTTAEINFNVTAIDSASFDNYLVGRRNTIENIINNSLATNGSVRRTIKQVV